MELIPSEEEMFIEADSNQIIIKMKKGSNIDSAMQKCEEFFKTHSQQSSSRLNSSFLEETKPIQLTKNYVNKSVIQKEDKSSCNLNENVQKCIQFKPTSNYIQSKQLYETQVNYESMDDDLRTESFGQYQEECDLLMLDQANSEIDYCKSSQDQQELINETNSVGNSLQNDIKSLLPVNLESYETGDFYQTKEIILNQSPEPYSNIATCQIKLSSQLKELSDCNIYKRNETNRLKVQTVENNKNDIMSSKEVYQNLQKSSNQNVYKNEVLHDCSSYFTNLSSLANAASNDELKSAIPEDNQIDFSKASNCFKKQNHEQNQQINSIDLQEHRLYKEIEEINRAYDKIKRNQEFISNDDYLSEIKQRKIDFDETCERSKESCYKTNYVSPQERGYSAQQNFAANVKIQNNMSINSSLERSCYDAKESYRNPSQSRYSFEQTQKMSNNNCSNPILIKVNMSQIHEKLIKQNKLHYEDMLQK